MEKNLSPREVVHKARDLAQDVLVTAQVRELGVLATAEHTADVLKEKARRDADELRIRNSLKPQWMLDHEESDRKEFAAIRGMLPSEAERKQIVDDALHDYFESKGSLLKRWIVGAAIIGGSITALGVSVQTILGWLGIFILRK